MSISLGKSVELKMKRDCLAVAVLCVAFISGCFASKAHVRYPVPAVPEGYVAIDAYEVGRPEDYVKVYNCSTNPQFEVSILYHNPKTMQWEPFGVASLKRLNDRDTMKHSTDIGGGLSNLRYFAVKFLDGVPHGIRLSGEHHDLHIRVTDPVQ